MKNPPLKYRIAKEAVALSGVAELVLGVYVGFQFGVQDTLRAWLFVGILSLISYISTRLWLWVLECMNGRNSGTV